MALKKDLDIYGLRERKLHAVKALLKSMKDWDKSADYENEAVFSANMAKMQKMLDKVALIDKELTGVARQIPVDKRSPAESELTRKTDEMLRQAQSIILRDIKQVENSMCFFLSEVKRLRQSKSGLAAYMNNGRSIRSNRFNLTG